MRKRTLIVALMLTITGCLLLAGEPAKGVSLKDVYKTGKLNLTEQFRIDYDTVPENIPNKGITTFTVTEKENIFTTDINLHNIKAFDREGKFIKTFGQSGAGPGDLNLPSDIVAVNGNIIVWEIGNRRFSFFTENGKYLKSVKRPDRPMIRNVKVLKGKGLIVEIEKYNYGLNIGQECILQLYSTDLELKKEIYRHDVLTNKFIKKPVRINVLQPFQPQVSWDVSPNGNVIVGFEKEYIVEIHDTDKGKVFSFTHEYEPVKVTEEDKKAVFDSMVISRGNTIKKGAPKYIRDNTTFPTYKPVFSHIIVDAENNILVFPYRDKNNKDKLFFDAFDSRGTFINRVETESAKFNPHQAHFGKNGLWTTIVNDEEEYVLIKYKIGE